MSVCLSLCFPFTWLSVCLSISQSVCQPLSACLHHAVVCASVSSLNNAENIDIVCFGGVQRMILLSLPARQHRLVFARFLTRT